MNRDEQVKTIYEFIKGEHICVLSTVTPDNKSESAAMAFSETPDLKLMFSTSVKARKYQNISNNNNVSFVIGWDFDKYITVQYEGLSREVFEEEIDKVRDIHTAKNEESRKYAYDPDNKYYVVEPKWIRYWSVRENIKFELEF